MTGGGACRSTFLPTVAPSARAYVAVQGAHERFSAPAAAAQDSVNHRRRCTDPPRGYRPGRSPRSSVRATSTVVPIRPSGLRSTSQPSATHHHTPGHDRHPRGARRRDEHRVRGQQPGEPAQTDQRGERQAEDRLETCDRSGVGSTTRVSAAAVGSNSSSRRARSPIRGYSYTSATVTVGKRSRRALTSCAATRLPPPAAKKSSRGPATVTPSAAVQRSATHSPVAVRPTGGADAVEPVAASSGHGSASRSTFPEPRVGMDSTGASSGTRAAGNEPTSRWRASARSSVTPGSGTRYPTSTEVPAGVRRTAAAAPATPGRPSSAESTSPSSIRRPPTFTWSSARPTNSSPSASYRTRSPLRYARAQPSGSAGAYFSASLTGSRYRASPTPPMISSPSPPSSTWRPVGRDDREVPPVERVPDPHGPVAGQQRRARDDGRLRRPVRVPDLAPLPDQPRDELGRAGLAAEDEQPHAGQLLGPPQPGERRHGRDDGDALRHQPRAEVHAGAHQRARRGDQAGAVRPREPHLLAAGVERHGQPRQHAVARAERCRLEEQPRLGVHERGGRPVRDRDPLRCAGRARGEDDPGVVVEPRRRGSARVRRVARSPSVSTRATPGLPEHGPRALVGVVDVDRHVGRPGREHREDRRVELRRARRDAHADAVAGPDAHARQAGRGRPDRLGQLPVGQDRAAVVDRPGRHRARRRSPSRTSSSVRGAGARPDRRNPSADIAQPPRPLVSSRSCAHDPASGDPRTGAAAHRARTALVHRLFA